MGTAPTALSSSSAACVARNALALPAGTDEESGETGGPRPKSLSRSACSQRGGVGHRVRERRAKALLFGCEGCAASTLEVGGERERLLERGELSPVPRAPVGGEQVSHGADQLRLPHDAEAVPVVHGGHLAAGEAHVPDAPVGVTDDPLPGTATVQDAASLRGDGVYPLRVSARGLEVEASIVRPRPQLPLPAHHEAVTQSIESG